MKGKRFSLESVELYIYRVFTLIVLIYHLAKYLKYEFSHW